MEKRYDAHAVEKNMQALWEQENTYTFSCDDQKKLFSIDTPPPTVSGTLHIGHIFSYTHTDIIARYKRMNGYQVFYPMGFDDNGLPTERFVEKEHKIKASHLKRSEFIALCLKETKQIEKKFETLWRSIGLSVDWTTTYSTISDQSRAISQSSFLELYKKKLIYRKAEPALYCTTCQTAVAQAEIDHEERTTQFNEIIFADQHNTPLIIATTRPELLPACIAVFYHPEDTRYTHLAGSKATVPLFGRSVPIIADHLVDPEKGTGLVMCCTFGDQNDISWFKRYKLPCHDIIGHDGRLSTQSGPVAGMKTYQARARILELLASQEALHQQKPLTHQVSVHERCKQEIEYKILTQWFIDILSHKQTFLSLAERITWYPAFMKSRYVDWVHNLNWDWCISRQRFYGIPFPIWHCNQCRAVLCAPASYLPVDPQETPYPGIRVLNVQAMILFPTLM